MPVNEYKIADKIIAANKSLFESNDQAIVAPPDPEERKKRRKPRVTFSTDIEEYEDDSETETSQSQEDSGEHKTYQPAMDNSLPKDNDATSSSIEEVVHDEKTIEDVDATVEHIEEICEDIDIIKLDPVEDCETAEEMDDAANCTVVACKVEGDNTMAEELVDIDSRVNETSQDSVGAVEMASMPPPTVTKTRSSRSAKIATNKAPTPKLRKSSSTPNIRKNSATAAKSEMPPKPDQNADDDDLMNIRLNFKCCCEHKYLESSRLPRYRGYFSQYGLSKEELEARDERKELMRRIRYENWLRKNEERAMKSLINEHAYAQWLTDKMRNVPRKEKNMYDYDIHGRRLPKKVHKGVSHASSWKY